MYHYSRQFDSIELNVTHYQIPPEERILKWKEMTPKGFLFCPKFDFTILSPSSYCLCH
ncbi:MAG: hypothetical protein COZ18_01865 [Flexibacter sp. CG_4_10_14_3_um_filter_32_15]|nr:MAG: hypothetical protein COZ18_01865 [Flexibacter sp. CG_4_10_14_3_um_filter_32_15]